MSDKRAILIEAGWLLATVLGITAAAAVIVGVLLYLLGTWPAAAIALGVPFLWLVWNLAAYSVETRTKP